MSSGPESYASTAAVAGLVREVEALRRAVEPLRGLPSRVEQLARLVAELAETTATDGLPCRRPVARRRAGRCCTKLSEPLNEALRRNAAI
jgi:hypothetical protein